MFQLALLLDFQKFIFKFQLIEKKVYSGYESHMQANL